MSTDSAPFPTVFVTPEEVLAAPHTALIVWDMQVGIASRATNLAAVRPALESLLEAARGAGVTVIWSKHVAPPVTFTPGPVLRMMMARQALRSPRDVRGGLEEGTPEVQFLPGLVPLRDELVLTKSTASFFVDTPLEIRLRARGIATLVLAGVATEHGIEFTARHAGALGFYVVVAADACGTFDLQAHENSLRYLRSGVDVLDSAEIAAVWRRN